MLMPLNNLFYSLFNNPNSDFIELLGFKIYFDDLLLLCIIFFLYKENTDDQFLLLILIMLLFN